MPRSIRRTASLLLPLLLTSCFTMHLWGFEFADEDPHAWETGEPGYTYDPETEWSWKLFGLRVLATPFALALDCVTCPVQVFLFCNDDDDDPHRR
jgi:hypothetical protein